MKIAGYFAIWIPGMSPSPIPFLTICPWAKYPAFLSFSPGTGNDYYAALETLTGRSVSTATLRDETCKARMTKDRSAADISEECFGFS